MLDIRRVRDDIATIEAGLRKRGADVSLVHAVADLDTKRRDRLSRAEALKAERNRISKQIGLLKREGKETSEVQASVRAMGTEISDLNTELSTIEAALNAALLKIPNVPSPTTPVGQDETANVHVRRVGACHPFAFEPKGHVELGEALGLFDFGRATRMTGSGFPLLVGQGARLQRALIQFMLDMHVTKHGYTEVLPPFVVNTETMTGTGQLPKMAEDMYHCEVDDLWLIPTAEVPVTNIYRQEIIEDALPIRLTAYTPCFRREAGAAGKQTRGLIRVHQFDKVEMVKFVEPSTSYDELETLLDHAEDVLKALGLTYRVLELCSGDLSFAAAKCYDIELWAPGQQDWLEVSSCSNFEDFQSRRAGIRYRNENGKPAYLHTLNGSGVALPRLVVAILETGQQADGSVVLPEAIRPYMGGIEKLTPPA